MILENFLISKNLRIEFSIRLALLILEKKPLSTLGLIDFFKNTDQIREVLDNGRNLKYTIMKNLLLLMLIPLIGIAQTPSSLTLNENLANNSEDKMLLLKNMKDAIKFQNIHRSYFEYKPLVFDQKLTDEAQQWADYLAVINNPEHSTVKDGKGELIFYAPTNYFKESSNLLIKASVFWVLSEDDVQKLTLDQILCQKCNKIGFGIAQSLSLIHI